MRTIWKYDIRVGEEVQQLWAPGTKIVHVAPDEMHDDAAQFWLEHDKALAGTGRRVTLYLLGTGHPIPDGYTHIGTAVGETYVWHLFALYA